MFYCTCFPKSVLFFLLFNFFAFFGLCRLSKLAFSKVPTGRRPCPFALYDVLVHLYILYICTYYVQIVHFSRSQSGRRGEFQRSPLLLQASSHQIFDISLVKLRWPLLSSKLMRFQLPVGGSASFLIQFSTRNQLSELEFMTIVVLIYRTQNRA